MGDINREGILRLAEVILDAASEFKGILGGTSEEAQTEPETEQPKNRFDKYPTGTLVSTVIDKDKPGESTFLHVKRADGDWDEFALNGGTGSANRITIYSGGVAESEGLAVFDSQDHWTLTVLTEDVQ